MTNYIIKVHRENGVGNGTTDITDSTFGYDVVIDPKHYNIIMNIIEENGYDISDGILIKWHIIENVLGSTEYIKSLEYIYDQSTRYINSIYFYSKSANDNYWNDVT